MAAIRHFFLPFCTTAVSRSLCYVESLVTQLDISAPYFFFFLYFLSFFLFSGNAVLQLHTDVFTFFTALLLCCCVSFCSLLDGVCLSGNKRITYLLTYIARFCWNSVHWYIIGPRDLGIIKIHLRSNPSNYLKANVDGSAQLVLPKNLSVRITYIF